ncbi:MAG: TRAP transporter substrate-binding protein DctP [Spirochaetales bacterium]|jgi:TRAP-type C4-dicarboxylate transport system substrate-binding protein|nr:TRAP transporter substrate-binding protein DctP [Spirochaetales bacterium]
MYKRWIMILSLAATIPLLTVCNKSSDSAAPSATPQSPSVSTSGGAWWDKVDFSKKVQMTFASTNSPGFGAELLRDKAIKLISERSRGAIEIEEVFNGALGNEQSSVAQCMEGALELCGIGIGTISKYSPYLDVSQMPFLINSYELEAKVLQLKEFKALVEKANADLRDVRIITIGGDYRIRHFATIQKPIKTMSDIKGLKIRSIGNPVIDEALKIVGANPVNITYIDLYSALQNKIIDGEEINTSSISMQKHYEVVNYMSEIGLYPFISGVVMNTKIIESLPGGYFDLIQECFIEADKEYMEKTIYEFDKQMRQDCIDHGVGFNVIEDKAAWLEAMAPLYQRKMAESPLYASFIKAVQDLY